MTIKRQYSLPNCRLLLEGIVNEEVVEGEASRPLMSILVHAECSFTGSDQTLTGGRTFLDNLTRAVSAYAQEFLSGVQHPLPPSAEGERVQLVRGDRRDLHHLRCYPKAADGEASAPIQIDLNTVQLFDLVEAVDQLFADTCTLPELALQLAPVSRRYRQADVPVVQRSAPLALGVSGLALAALALFLVPVPGRIEEPERKLSDTASETADEAETEATDTPETAASPSSPSLSADELAAALADAQQILDPTELDYIQRYTRRELDRSWENRDELTQDLTYRLSVGRDGAILAYEPVEGTPAGADEQTPLPDLVFQPTQDALPEAIAEYKVVFTANGILQINPWAGYQGTPTLGPRLDAPDQLAKLGEQLQTMLASEWEENPDLLSDELTYRVGVTEDGAIADYVAQNAAAFELETETPLPELLNPAAAGIGEETLVPQQPLGQFQVTFYKDGRVEVAPF